MLIRDLGRQAVPYAVFEDAVPTCAQAKKILKYGYGLHLLFLPETHHDFAFLDSFAGGLEYLSVTDGRVRDVSPILELKGLKELALSVLQKEEIPLSRLSALTRYSGPMKGFADVVSCPSLRKLTLRDVREGVLGAIIGPVEDLELVDLHNLRVLPELRNPTAPRQLYLSGARTLDISGVASFTELRTAGFDACRELKAVDALVGLPKLEVLGFEKCWDINPLDALLELTDVGISVTGRNPFTQQFRDAASRSRSTWTYYGAAPIPK